MSRIRHIAIYTDDPEAQASFYCKAFDLKEVRRSAEAISLSDGYLGVTLLKTRPNSPPRGLHHFGFQVESIEATEQRLREIQPDIQISRPGDVGTRAEYKVRDPEGNVFDISEQGWVR